MVTWIFNSPGIGSLVVFAIAISVLIAYYRMLRWIQSTPRDPSPAEHASPEDVTE